mmetsp:Transcript_28846/g.76325  ORF Transcript_28846/g.76325 Transcript_28846/m.76325 type:complete len:87 (+) Transcript_28846:1449-1709(+)
MQLKVSDTADNTKAGTSAGTLIGVCRREACCHCLLCLPPFSCFYQCSCNTFSIPVGSVVAGTRRSSRQQHRTFGIDATTGASIQYR